jgi:hypothetical protein
MSYDERSTDGAERQAQNGKLQMLGGVGLFELGMNLPNPIWGAAALASSIILEVYGLRDYLIDTEHE